MQAVSLERFYLKQLLNDKIAKKKQKKTIELVHYSTWYSTTYFMS